MSSDNGFADKAINKFLFNKDASLSVSLSSIKADDSKAKEESGNKKTETEKESKAESAYEDYLENWKQGDRIPIVPPGKEFILCRVNLDDTRSEKEAGYHDIPELTKKPYKKSSPEEQLIEFKNLGPKLSSSLTSILGRVAKSRGLWIDDKNKLRCPPGSPAANQFTDITGSNCFIPSPETAAGSARRAVRRAVNGADVLSSPLGGRTDTSFAGTEQRVQAYTTDDFGMVHAAMGVGGRIGMPDRMKGPVWDRGRAVRGTEPGKKSWQLSAREQRERGRILTTQADVLHRRLMGQGAPLGLTRDARATLRAMDRQVASPSNFLLPSGNPVGDILNKGNFMRAMTEILPNVDPNELENAFDNSIPAGLTLKERVEAQLVVRTFFEGMIFEAIQNPEHFKWITQFNTGMIGTDPLCAFEVKVSPFAPSPLTGGRRAGVAVTNLARSGTQVGETGGMHVSMNFNPVAAYLYARQANRTKFSDGSGEFDSIQGRALYLGVHESGHVVDFGEKFKAMGLNPSTLSRFGKTTTLVSTPSGPARQPNFYSGGWDVDWSMVTNPTGNLSIQEMMDAATALQTNSYTGSRFGGRRIDLMDDLNKFHLGFTDAFTNNINTTEAEHTLMAQFAGGDYAASSPIEARAEFYTARRLFGESTKFPSTVYPAGGPIKSGLKEMNLVEKFAESEGLRRATSESNSGLIPASDIPTRARTLQGEVLNELKNAGRDTFGVPTGGWNVSGLMSTPERNGRVSLHARRVQDLVAATDIQTQRKRRGTNIPSGVSGKMSELKTPQEIAKDFRPARPRVTESMEEALKSIQDGEVVTFDAKTENDVAVFLDKLSAIAKEAKKLGKNAPNYNLCEVTLAGTSFFCDEILKSEENPEGIPRALMPQIVGNPTKGTIAFDWPRTQWDDTEVDGGPQFQKFLIEELKIASRRENRQAATLKASQNELIGAKVATMMTNPNFDLQTNPLFISSDGFIIDGHHRWAAAVGRDTQDGSLGNYEVAVIVVDSPISEILKIANEWTQSVGLKAREGVSKETAGVSGKMATPEIRKPSRPREPDNGPYTGRFLEIFSGVKDFADFRDRYRKEDVIYFDYETTGFGADGNMPVQIGAVRMRGGQVVERFNVFVNPGMPLGEWAQKNLKDGSGNPLTDAWLAQQESLKGAHEKLIEFFGEDALIGGQYTPFDLEVFDRVTRDLGISYKPGGVIDSKALADETLPRWTPDKPDGPTMVEPKTGYKKGSSSLGPLAEYLGVDLGDGWHTADADAEASALVTERMLDRAVANPDVTPRTILDPDEMPNIVERRRKKYAADMEQYERDKIDYEAGISGKMSVPQFETANGSTYERQPDGRYKRRKDPVRSTTIDGPVEKIQKKTSAEDIAKDAESAEKLRTEQKRLESMSDGELDTLFSDGEYTYVVHFGAEEITGGEMDPARSVGAGDSFDADTRGINKTYSDAFVAQYNTEKATAEHVSSVVDTLKNEGQIDSPLSGTVPGTALNPYDSIYSGYYMKKGARRDRFSQDKDRPWPDADDLTEMGMTREELIDSLEKNTVPVLEDRWRPKTETVKKLESNEGQFTSAFTVAGVVSGKDNPEAYGGRYSEGYDAATADRQDRIDSFAQNSRMGIHILRVKMGEDATRLGFGNKTQREVHMLGKHKVVASMAAPTWGKREDLEGRDFFKGWMADVVEKDKAARAAEVAGKPADVVETTFDNTVFLTPDAKQAVQLAADRGRHIGSNGELMGLSYDDGNLNTPQLLKLRRDGETFDEAFEKAGGVISHYPINRSEIRESPQVGLNPFEWDNDGKKTHTGSPVSAVTRRPGNDVDQTPSAGSGVSGKMTLAQAETRKSIVDDKLERYKKAVKEYDETGEWNGAEYGVVTALPSERDAALHLDNPEVPARNMNMLQYATEDADKKGLTGADKEKFIADELKKRRADMDRKIQFLEREQKLAESLIKSKSVRSEQNVLDIEDISPEEIEKLKAESAEIRRLKASDKPEDRELFAAMMKDGDTRYITHAGESELTGGVLQGSASIGAEASYSGGTGGGSGDTRGLNNEVVANMKGRVLSWGKSISILDKAIKEAEDSGTFTNLDRSAEFAFRGFSGFDRTLREANYGQVFNIVDDIGYTKERWIEALKSQRDVFAKNLEIEQTILSRIEKDDYQFLSAELADRFADAGMGYYGRYSHRRIPAEISKNVGSGTDIAAGMGLNKPEIKDPEMTQRWLDSLRGTIWITKGKRDVEWTNLLGPSSEVQILGKTKPIVGFSSKINSKYDLAEILPALLVRAINEDRKNNGTIRPLVVAGSIDANYGVSGKMTNNAAASKANTQSIFGKLKALKERLGYGTDFDEKVSKEKLDKAIQSSAEQAKVLIDLYFGKDIVLPQGAIDYIHKMAIKDKFFGSNHPSGVAAEFWPIALALDDAGMSYVWKKNQWGYENLPPNLALEISRQIHIARGNTEMVAKIDEFKNYLKTATPEQLSEDTRAASLTYGKSIEKRVLVRTKPDNIKSFIRGNRKILTQHDEEERKATGILSTNMMGDGITTSARRKVEGNILGLPFQEGVADSPEVKELRPTSGYITTSKTAAARRDKFKKIYGDDIKLMYDGPAGEALEASQNGTWKYGDAHFVLRPEVAERTRVFNADTVDLSTKDNPPLQLSSLEDGIFLGGNLNPIGMLYDYRTGDTYPTPSGAFEASSDNGSRVSYKEALVVGTFKPEEVEAIIATPADFRKELGEVPEGRRADSPDNVSLLIDMAQRRDELIQEHGIEVVPYIRAGVFATNDVEMFNPAMTDVWFDKNFGDKGLSKEEIIPDKSTTPYEAYLRILIASEELPEMFEYRGSNAKSQDEKNIWRRAALKEELDRVGSVKNQTSGVSGKMSALTPEQMTVRNESIKKGIEESGGSWGGGDFVPDSYRESIAEIDAASWAAGGQFRVNKPDTKEQTRKDIDSFIGEQYREIQAHLRGETGDYRFINYDLGFLEHLRQMTPEQFAQEVRDANISFHAGIDPRVRVQVPIPEFISVLANGYKTTHEVRSDHSARAIRLPYEASIGIHPKTPANLRPASGYIVHQDWLEAELQAASKDIETQGFENAHPELLARGETLNIVKAGRGSVEIYGGVEVILRPEVAERTKYLHGDSLITKGSPTSMTGTDITSIQKAQILTFEAGNSVTEMLYGHWSKNHAASHRHMVRDGENIPKGGGAGPTRWKNESYMEALIAGSFDSGDIDEIVISGLDNVPFNWIFDSESKPSGGRAQQIRGGQTPTGRVYPPAIDHLRDEKKLIEKLGFTPEEAKIGARIAIEKFSAEDGKPGAIRRETHLFAAIAMREALEKKGIKFTVKHERGYDVFDPKTVNPDALSGSTVKEALVFKIEEFLKRMVREEIAEAGRKAQKQASSSEKVDV